MRLQHNAHLAYCTNVHPGKDWEQTFRSLQQDVLAVRRNVCPDSEYAIGLRLSASAAQELSQAQALTAFKRWLEDNHCYVFTINGFPYGDFHGTRVKEQVYRPDWTTQDRLDYTKLLFELLTQFLPKGESGSVSTLPGSFKRFIDSPEQHAAIHQNLYQLYQHIEKLSEKTGHDLHLGLEPEPLGLFENTDESLAFYEQFLQGRADADAIRQRIGINYDTCHFALEYEDPATALERFSAHNIRISKIHLSSALKVRELNPTTLDQLETFCEPTYLHQVLAATHSPTHASEFTIQRYEDLPDALDAHRADRDTADEWRIHFHIPLHSAPQAPLLSTNDHLLGTLDYISRNPKICQHFEMETYTWAVMPPQLHSKTVVEQVTAEYQWLIPQLKNRSLI
ncbi:metabolite traffic protein EboE [Pelagicoccus sp. NFK12]|uniref:Metabolite traffic protein EboE n=1 Tax=Pelagicoccus enzymogenes TaxID=2773457 RepID=A0A927FBS9_9BACT|nr:metabolite traffic protein EboE [Pelagicoccus enzymogenes]MBD5781959.1 metabolite traffic protein EboE [Pelagicoccus enzymogenes]